MWLFGQTTVQVFLKNIIFIKLSTQKIECHSFCTACETTDRLCSECLDNPGIKLINGNSCVCQITNGYFIRKNAQLEDECIPCHPMCKMCHGTSFIECDECWDDITLLAPYRDHICNCLPPFFYDSTKTEHDKFCQPCQDFCQACIGVIKSYFFFN